MELQNQKNTTDKGIDGNLDDKFSNNRELNGSKKVKEQASQAPLPKKTEKDSGYDIFPVDVTDSREQDEFQKY